MRVGMLGLGKLGLPVAVAMTLRGQKVMGFDLDINRMTKNPQSYKETGPDGVSDFNSWLEKSDIEFGSISEVVTHSEIIFCAVQTPHQPKFEGITPIPVTDRADFDYYYLRQAVASIASEANKQKKRIALVVISTALPGTMRKHILPLCNDHTPLVYNPSFIAMGCTMTDFLNPEFVLIGVEDQWAKKQLIECYNQIFTGQDVPIRTMSLESAELTKVAYNTYISQKLAFVNTMMEICDKIPEADVDEVTSTIKLATNRLISTQYLSGGMGDGGSCTTGDTKISLLNGKEVPIEDLCSEEEFWVHSYDLRTNRIMPGRARECRKTNSNVPIVKVTLDSGEIIRCTGDHEFLLVSGDYIRVDELKSGTNLLSLHREKDEGGYVRVLQPTDIDLYPVEESRSYKIEIIEDDGFADVYNFEVDTYENYALSSGVFVHNCHPRDNIAMSWLAGELNLSRDIFQDIMRARDAQAAWFAKLLHNHHEVTNHLIAICGVAYKPHSGLTVGSHALLVSSYLESLYKHLAVLHDPYVPMYEHSNVSAEPHVILIGMRHREFQEYQWAEGSVVIDPWRYIPDREGVTVVRLGERKGAFKLDRSVLGTGGLG